MAKLKPKLPEIVVSSRKVNQGMPLETCLLMLFLIPLSRKDPRFREKHSGETASSLETQQDSRFPRLREWIPPALRWPRLILLALSCLGVVALLEILDVLVRNHQGLRPENSTIVNLVRYLPTVAMIAIGFGLKSVVSDLKVITPWSSMNNRWATADDSVSLDYVNGLEIQSVFLSIRRRHWALALGLVLGLLSGILVPLANSLLYLNTRATITIPVPFLQTSTFDFKDTLVLPNGSLPIPFNYTGQKPYAALASERQANGSPSPWTNANLAFDIFTPATHNASGNTSIMADVTALSANLRCSPLRYVILSSEFELLTIGGNEDDLAAANCSLPVEQYFVLSESNAIAFLNITQCSKVGDDPRILVTLAMNSNTTADIKTMGLICSPSFSTQKVRLEANGTTGRATQYVPVGDLDVIDNPTSVEALWIYLENPLDTNTMEAFGRAQGPGPFDATAQPLATFSNITGAAEYLVLYQGTDPFMSLLTNGQTDVVRSYLLNPEVFQADVETLAGDTWAQVFNTLARKKASISIQGTLVTGEPRFFIRAVSLRALQILLACIGLACGLGLHSLRPKTLLSMDPAQIITSSLILARSSTTVEEQLGLYATSTNDSTIQGLRYSKWSTPAAVDQIEFSMSEVKDAVALRSEEGTRNSGESGKSKGWQPWSFRFAAKICLTIGVAIIMVALGVLQWISRRDNGLAPYTYDASTAGSFIPTTILVLLGYAFSGTDRATRSLTTYKKLWKASSRQNLRLAIRDTISWSPRHKAERMPFTVFTSAIVLLSFPVVKLVAAGLFDSVSSFNVENVAPLVDVSLPENLASTFSLSEFNGPVRRASEFTEWANIPSFNVPKQAGIVNNLVLSNVTNVSLSPNSDQLETVLQARVPAIAVDINCTPIPSSAFNLSVVYEELFDASDWYFAFYCKSISCSALLNQTAIVDWCSIDNDSTLTRYSGSSFTQNPDASLTPSMQNSNLPSLVTTAYNVILTDWSTLMVPFGDIQNAALMDLSGNRTNNTIWASPDTFSFSLPTIRAVSCTRNLSVVQVDATFVRSSKLALRDNTTILPWSPIAINASSISYERTLPNMQPYWFYPITQPTSQYTVGQDLDGMLNGNSLWPNLGSPTNFWVMLAAYAQFEAGNLTSLLDADGLASATKNVLTAYCTQILTQLRPLALSTATASQTSQVMQGTVTYPEPRLAQNLNATIALEAFFALVLCCMIWIFIQFPSDSILPQSPDSIAARLSLLAGSSIVKRLRDGNIARSDNTDIWSETAALGWWKKVVPENTIGPRDGTLKSSAEWRWGIDVGSGVVLHSWNDPPDAPVTANSPEPTHTNRSTSIDDDNALVVNRHGLYSQVPATPDFPDLPVSNIINYESSEPAHDAAEMEPLMDETNLIFPRPLRVGEPPEYTGTDTGLAVVDVE